jgi:hypothetical protein
LEEANRILDQEPFGEDVEQGGREVERIYIGLRAGMVSLPENWN